jgi:mono/diheme cytochrome c family protein
MPHLGIEADAAQAITAFLFGLAPQEPDVPPGAKAASKGRSLFIALGCVRCHGGEDGEARGEVGPDLDRAGEKLRPEWLSRFLARPYSIRPWLTSRMPDFRLGGEEIRVLAKFIGGLKDEPSPQLPERLRFQGGVSEANVQAGRRLASREFLSCSSCHLGEEQPEGSPEELAPDLRMSAERLNPDWIVRWLRDPGRVLAGTRMPAYFSDDTSGPEEILDGDEERQILALRDYILSLGGIGLKGAN